MDKLTGLSNKDLNKIRDDPTANSAARDMVQIIRNMYQQKGVGVGGSGGGFDTRPELKMALTSQGDSLNTKDSFSMGKTSMNTTFRPTMTIAEQKESLPIFKLKDELMEAIT
jgi:hypothetical protein